MGFSKEIVIDSANGEIRAAVVSGGNAVELFVEKRAGRSIVGNIYKGRVLRVLPGMQSAFVDIGMTKAAFLHVVDVMVDEAKHGVENIVDKVDVELGEDNEDVAADTSSAEHHHPPIEDLLKSGQEIVVQVVKDPISAKGARLTTHVSIPGRYIVVMPSSDHNGVSRKINSAEERERLKSILASIKPANVGLIARTVSEGASEDELAKDLDYALRIWEMVESKIKKGSPPFPLYEEQGLLFKILRDVATNDVTSIVTDNKIDYMQIKSYLRDYMPNTQMTVELYDKNKPIFDYYNLELELNRVMDKKVWLKSGGYLIIDTTEALTVIDVNTGRYVGKRNFDETILRTNIEAAKEIAVQLRLRNIGGIIVVDFIDMDYPSHNDKVLSVLEEELKFDRVKTNVVGITSLGLVEITRKRSQENIVSVLSESCPYCEGKGIIKSKSTVSGTILKGIKRVAPHNKGATIQVECHNDVADILLNYEKDCIEDMELFYNIKIEISQSVSVHIDFYKIIV